MNLVRALSLFLFFWGVVIPTATNAFEVKGNAISTTYCARGKCETAPCTDEVVYEVDFDQGVFIRKAIINTAESLKDTPLGGLQGDDTKYSIIYVGKSVVVKDSPETQAIMKGIGQTGSIDGFETVVIGEDFINTSRSSADYFVLYYYKRTK